MKICSALALYGISLTAWASCGASFCSLAQPVPEQQGYLLDLRHEYIELQQPRAGSQAVDVGEIHRHHDEQRTLNRNTLLNLDYRQSDWGLSFSLPWLQREHQHIHNHHRQQLHDAWDLSGLGDLKALVVQDELLFGLKLPTGSTERHNSNGDKAEPGLQPGTGSTDLILGLQSAVNWGQTRSFFRFSWQNPLNERHQFQVGSQLKLDLGTSYRYQDWNWQLQLNAERKGRDGGERAEAADSGGKALWLSPGLGLKLTEATEAYLFWQLPLYQYRNGVQLTADDAWGAGIRQSF